MSSRSEPLRAIIGARVSVVSGDEKVSHLAQHESGYRWAVANGAEVVDTFQDLDVSATVPPEERADLGPWLRADRVGQWDAIVFAKVDRAFRSAKHCVDFAEWCKDNGKVLVFTENGYTLDYRQGAQLDPMAQMFLTISASFAEIELARIRARARETRAFLAGTDRWAGGPVPYGFRTADHPNGGRKLEQDPVTSAIVRRAGEMLIAGSSLLEIAATFTADGIPTPVAYAIVNRSKNSKGKRKAPELNAWNSTTISGFLRSPATQGLKCAGSNRTTRRVVRGKDGMPIRMSEAIFTDQEWDQIQGILDSRASSKERVQNAAPLLGVVFCGVCSGRLYRLKNKQKAGGKTYNYEYYRCQPTTPGGRKPCKGQSFRGDLLTNLLDELVPDELANIPVMRKVFVPGEDHSQELAKIIRAIDGIRDERDLGMYDYSGGDEEYTERLASLVQRRKALEALPQRPDKWAYEPTGESYADAYTRMNDFTQRRQLLVSAGVRLEISKPVGRTDALTWHFMIPSDLRERVSAFEVSG